MNETTLTKPKRATNAEDKAFLAQLLADMNVLEEQMDKVHADSERSKAETEIIKAETEIIKAETEIIKARTATTLSQIMRQINDRAGAV